MKVIEEMMVDQIIGDLQIQINDLIIKRLVQDIIHGSPKMARALRPIVEVGQVNK